MSSDSQPAGSQSDAKQCTVCKGPVKSTQCLVCHHCGDLVHLSCQVKLFKDAGNEPLKNKQDWLQEFLRFSSLVHQCKACTEKHKAVPPASNANSKEICEMKQSIAALDSKISSILSCINLSNGSLHDHDSTKQSVANSAPSYAQVVSDAVKQAVKTSIATQKKEDEASTSVVIYGLDENGYDCHDLVDILKVMKCRIQIVNAARIGAANRPRNNGVYKSRPLKVDLASKYDRDTLLASAYCLRQFRDCRHIRISRWLSKEEMEKIKVIRNQCANLNKESGKTSRGNLPYVVVSGYIMKRMEDGKLRRLTPDSKDNNSIAAGTSSVPAGGLSQDASSESAVGVSSADSSSQSKNDSCKSKNGAGGSQ